MYEDLIILKETKKVSQFVWVQAKGMIVLQAFKIEERIVNTIGRVPSVCVQRSN